MIRIYLTLAALLLGSALSAQSLPERYMVSGVSADDVLNIRSEPSSASEIIGKFGPHTLNVEILRVQDGWGYTGAGERSGWVSMRYLSPNPAPAGELPRPMSCFGTEPFWDIDFHPRGTRYRSMGEEPAQLNTQRESIAPNGFLIDMQEGESTTRTMIINALPCNDGMSDRDFGMSITLFSATPAGNSVRTGCCTLQVN